MWWVLLFLAFSPFDGLQRIALRNQYAVQAEAAYKKKEYQKAAYLYERVRQNEGGKPHSSIILNLAHSYFHLHEYSRASPLYRTLLNSKDPQMLSSVATQLSFIETEEGNLTKAIGYCKQALKADETNQAARYNFELLQKYLLLHPEKPKSPPPPQRRDRKNGAGGSRQQNTAGTPTMGGTGTASNSGTAPSSINNRETNPPGGTSNATRQENFGNSPGSKQGLSNQSSQNSNAMGKSNGSNQAGQEGDALLQTRFERLKKLQLTPEKARQLLDVMRQEEAQYLQQVPRKRTKQSDKNTPDW
ncbi:tetratricopeptide repeat protein [Rufibacter tibetensis]|uniref:Uncharacterized protein n=1 Tax=Rufibacter tibetensis TaxID=512763 RepID=A0A0P0CZT9_9BACT|nr:hypothetical protein [Rufibacter tibetensis]ALJ01013.1 hypothetical protein DC20_20995 [Rufibacter tibetensis]